MLSVITPAFNEGRNLPVLYERLSSVLAREGIEWEWLVVDDHSGDGTAAAIEALAARDRRIRGIRLARTFGSNAAIRCGLEEAAGSCAALVAGDLLDPPEVLPDMIRRWKDGAGIVWAVPRRSASARKKDWFSRAHRALLHRAAGFDAAASDAGFFLADRKALEGVRQFRDYSTSVFGALAWTGFRQDSVEFDLQGSGRDASALPFRERIELLAGTLTPFSDLLIRAGVVAGFGTVSLGVVAAGAAFLGLEVGPLSPGWVLLLSSIFIVGGLNVLFVGALGLYIWRTIESLRPRPSYLVERRIGSGASDRAATAAEPASWH